MRRLKAMYRLTRDIGYSVPGARYRTLAEFNSALSCCVSGRGYNFLQLPNRLSVKRRQPSARCRRLIVAIAFMAQFRVSYVFSDRILP
jgi:hypothetical protein